MERREEMGKSGNTGMTHGTVSFSWAKKIGYDIILQTTISHPRPFISQTIQSAILGLFYKPYNPPPSAIF
jgi:hypothetical protein